MNWKDKRVLVTGGCGFIGSALVKRLEQIGESEGICTLDLMRGQDVTDGGLVRSTIRMLKSQIVFHLAAQTEVRTSFREPELTYRINVMGTLNVLEACRACGVEALVVASSDKAYGDHPNRVCNEAKELWHNADAYSSSKAMADELCQDYHRLYHMPIRILRCANTFGPGQTNETTLITGTVCRLLKGEAPVIHEGRADVKREWLYIDDAVDAYVHLAQHASCSGELYNGISYPAYNVGSGGRYSVREVVDKIAQLMFMEGGMDLRLTRYSSLPEKAPQIGDQGLDSAKYRKLIGDKPFVTFDEGLKRTIAWHKEQMSR